MTIFPLPRRSNLGAKFSQFIYIEEKQDNVVLRWKSDFKLTKNFYQQTINLKTLDENQCFIYWLKRIETDTLAKQHLTAYLESISYWAIREFFEEKTISLHNLSSSEKYLKAFTILRDATTNAKKLFKEFSKFNPQLSHIKTYSKRWLKNVIRDGLYKEFGISKYSQWGQLKNTTKTNLKVSLEHQGYPEELITSHLLLWECFKKVYSDNANAYKGTKLTPPNQQQIEKIILIYEATLKSYPKLLKQQYYQNISPQLFMQIMNNCHRALSEQEKLKRPSAYAYNSTITSQENDSELLSFFDSELYQKYKEEQKINEKEPETLFDLFDKSEINEVLWNVVKGLKKNDQDSAKLLDFNYGLGLNQSTIAELLHRKQFQISRQKGRITAKLLKSFVLEIKQRLANKQEISDELKDKVKQLSSPELDSVKTFIEDWLTHYYQKPIYLELENLFSKLNNQSKQLIKLRYGGDYHLVNEKQVGLEINELATRFNLSSEEVNTKLTNIKNFLTSSLINHLNHQNNIKLDHGNKQINSLIERWLYQAPYDRLTLST